MKDINVEGLLKKVFENIGAKPERVALNVLLQKGGELKEIYVIPGRPEPYLTEQQARAELRKGETLYRLYVCRVE